MLTHRSARHDLFAHSNLRMLQLVMPPAPKETLSDVRAAGARRGRFIGRVAGRTTR
jgi:hypothetical protein